MDIRRFTEERTGELVQVHTLQGGAWAFVPALFPPLWPFPERLWPLVVEANKALANLDGGARRLPGEHLIRVPLHLREAQRSSNLEGTFTAPEQQLLFEVGFRTEGDKEDVSALREVANYSAALKALKNELLDFPPSLRLIRNLHSILLREVRGQDKRPGEFRSLQVAVGNPPRYIPPPPTALNDLLGNFEIHMHEPRRYDSLVFAFMMHYQFEAIHPFQDGNGRVGRLLLALLIEQWCGLSGQWLYMSDYFYKNRDDYYDRLFSVSSNGDWAGWIEFCLTGVVETARETDTRCQTLLDLRERYKADAIQGGGAIRLTQIIEGLFENPVIQIPAIAKRFGITRPTAKSDVERLVSAGILRFIGVVNGKLTYLPPELVEVIFS